MGALLTALFATLIDGGMVMLGFGAGGTVVKGAGEKVATGSGVMLRLVAGMKTGAATRGAEGADGDAERGATGRGEGVDVGALVGGMTAAATGASMGEEERELGAEAGVTIVRGINGNERVVETGDLDWMLSVSVSSSSSVVAGLGRGASRLRTWSSSSQSNQNAGQPLGSFLCSFAFIGLPINRGAAAQCWSSSSSSRQAKNRSFFSLSPVFAAAWRRCSTVRGDGKRQFITRETERRCWWTAGTGTADVGEGSGEFKLTADDRALLTSLSSSSEHGYVASASPSSS